MENKKINLTEEELKNIIINEVQSKLNEDNMFSRWWNRNKINNLYRRAVELADSYIDPDDENYGNSDVFEDYMDTLHQLERYDKKSARSLDNHYSDSMFDVRDNIQSNNEPVVIGSEPFEYNPSARDLNTSSQGDEIETPHQPIESNSVENNETQQGSHINTTEPTAENQSETNSQPETTQQNTQPSTPQYRRKTGTQHFNGYDADHNSQYADEYYDDNGQDNETVFKNQFVNLYNTVNNALKTISALPDIDGSELASQLTWGITSHARTKNFPGVNQQIGNIGNEISEMKSQLETIKGKLKAALPYLGVNDKAGYDYYGMEESKLHKIISNSIQKILKENKKN